MTDRELLEFAAKAAGLRINFHPTASYQWNPLERDDDALRLAVKLHMTVRCYMGTTVAQIGVPGMRTAYEDVAGHDDPYAATRSAIVRAAAAIGKEMP